MSQSGRAATLPGCLRWQSSGWPKAISGLCGAWKLTRNLIGGAISPHAYGSPH
jgi:hypothetical protein